MIKVIAPKRTHDNHGSGAYGARRAGGKRKHNGIDYAVWPDSQVMSECGGYVTKLGHPYGDDLSFRYVEVTDGLGTRWRYFYVRPAVAEGESIYPGKVIGAAQDLRPRYPGITPHAHLELIDKDGNYIDPEGYV